MMTLTKIEKLGFTCFRLVGLGTEDSPLTAVRNPKARPAMRVLEAACAS